MSSRLLRHVLIALALALSWAETPLVPHEVQASIDADNARKAAVSAKDAASVAKQVAAHSIRAVQNANSALKDAHDVIHQARIEAKGLSSEQQATLRNAEAKLKGTMVTMPPSEVRVGDSALTHQQVVEDRVDRVQSKIATTSATDSELASMQEELRQLHSQLDSAGGPGGTAAAGDKSVSQMDKELNELQDMLQALEEAEKNKPEPVAGHGELRAEIEHLQAAIGRLGKYGSISATLPDRVERQPEMGELRYRLPYKKAEPKVQLTPLADIAVGTTVSDAPDDQAPLPAAESPAAAEDVGGMSDGGDTSIGSSGQQFDIDTAMPYGELEPFGREDTAQELTESSIRESDEMVDQLERAEVAEEKRAVFRALTRLRGAAITSFDGIARSQTGNIDEYNKVHKWRNTHPLRHLADEESDVSKWAFPEDADF